MPRIRTVKPEFWSHPVMGKIDDMSRCVALALLNYADDKGYFYADPILVRNFCRPFDEDSTNVRRSLETLQKVGWIQVCSSPQNGEIGKVVNFNAHQKIDHASLSRIEKYFDSSRIRLGFTEDSTQDWIMDHGFDHGRDHPQTPTETANTGGMPDHSNLPALAIPELQNAVTKCFQAKNPIWPNMPRQVEAIRWLCDAFKVQAEKIGSTPENVALTMIERFWELKTSGRDFFRKQPFEPKMMESLWGQILAETEQNADYSDISAFDGLS